MTNPDQPALPCETYSPEIFAKYQPTEGAHRATRLASGKSGGLTAREHAALTLRIPDSGTKWLDEMIARAQGRDVASQQAAALISSVEKEDRAFWASLQKPNEDIAAMFAGHAAQVADAIIAGLNKEAKP